MSWRNKVSLMKVRWDYIETLCKLLVKSSINQGSRWTERIKLMIMAEGGSDVVLGHTDNAKARMNVCFQPPRKGVQYLFLSLKKQFCVLTFQVFQVPLVLICEPKNLYVSYK